MKTYRVHAVIKSWRDITVEAENPDEAIKKATETDDGWQQHSFDDEWEVAPDGAEDVEEIETT